MCKCSFVRVACVALGLLWAVRARAQEYKVDEPSGDVVFNGVRGAEVSLIFDHSKIVVNPGDQLDLQCGVRGTMRSCIWENENGVIYQIEDVHDNLIDGVTKPENTEGNECGIVINSADIGHHGLWTCKVFVVGKSLVGTKNVIVTIKPTEPTLEVDKSQGSLLVTSEDETSVKCVVAAARPAVSIRWYLGDTDITVSAETEETPTDKGGIYKSMSTLRRTFQPSDNGQLLMCSISHKTLLVPQNASIPLDVVFKPVEKPVSSFYQISSGSDYEVKLNFSANPSPIKREWRFGDSFDNIESSLPIPGSVDHYTADIEDLGNGKYTAKLLIAGFTESDANKRYLLVIENDYGETQYKVMLSMHEAPQDTLSGGAIAGIIIVLLIVVAAVGAAGYARYRQMFCFAPVASPDPEEGKDAKEEHDTESARGTNTSHALHLKNRLGQLTQVFKKPKKEQDTKLDEHEKKSLTKEEPDKDSPYKEQSPDDKEVVYAELDLGKGEPEKKTEVKAEDKTEYAQIVGTLTDNREDEKKE